MKLFKLFEKKIKKLTLKEFALIKTTLIIFGIIIGAYITNFVKQNILIFITLFAVGYVIILYNIFRKK